MINNERKGNLLTSLISVAILVGVIVILILQVKAIRNPPSDQGKQDQGRDYAVALQGQGLYKQAILAYQEYLARADLDLDKQANIYYLMADMYREKLRNYEDALAEYVRVKNLAPESTLIPEVNRKIVECLEQMNRSLDAQRNLENSTALKKEQKQKTEAVNVVAKIGDRIITLQDLHDEIQKLPQEMQKQYTLPEQKLEFLKQYVAKELLYNTALRRGYDQDPDLLKNLDLMRRELIVQRLVEEEIKGKIKITEAERQLYYESNKDRYAKEGEPGDGGEITRDKIESDMQREKEQSAYQELMQKALQAQEVQIFDYYFTSHDKKTGEQTK